MKRSKIMAAAVVAAVAVPGAALAAGWTLTLSSGSAAGSKASSLPTGPTPTLPVTGSQSTTSITVTWPTVNYVGTSTAVAGYTVARYKGGTLDTIAGTCTGTLTGNSCTDTVTVSGAYQYAITPSNSKWTGTEGAKSGTVTVTLGSLPVPGAPDLTAASDSGASNTDNITNSTAPTFTGTITGQAGLSVHLFAGSTDVGSVAAGAGTNSYTITSSALADGTYTFTAKSTTDGTTFSTASGGLDVTIDSSAPTITNIQSFQSDGTTAGNGQMEAGDKLVLTFNSAINTANLPTGTNPLRVVEDRNSNNNVTLKIDTTTGSVVLVNTSDTGSAAYVSSSGSKTATFTGGSWAASSGNTVLTITVGSTFSGTAAAASSGALALIPGAALTDIAGNQAATPSVRASTFKLF